MEAGKCEIFSKFLKWYNEKFSAQAYVDGYAPEKPGKFGKLCNFSKIALIFIRRIHKVSIKVLLKCVWRVPPSPCNQQGTGISGKGLSRNLQILKQNTGAHLTGTGCYGFSARVEVISDCVISCLRKRLMNEQITACTVCWAAITVLVASGTKSRLVADCIGKVVALLEENQVTTM